MALQSTISGWIFLILIYEPSACRGECGAAQPQVDTLLAEYDREAAPPVPASAPAPAPLLVSVALDVRHATVHEYSSTVHLLGDLQLKWKEPRLSWNESDWGCSSVLVSAERLWRPDVVLANAAGASGADDAALRARLASDGSVAWISRLDVTAPLDIDLEQWPADTQTCTFKFMSREYDMDTLDLVISKSKQLTVWMSGAWAVTSVVGGSWEWRREGGDRRVAAFDVTLQRRARAHAVAAGAVFAGALLLLAAGALLPPLHRVPLCACAAFISSLWMVSALLRLPPSATSPLVLRVLCAAGSTGAVAAAGAGLALRVARLAGPPPRPARALVLAAARLTKLTPQHSQEASESGAGAGAGAECGAWAAAAELLDLVCRALLAFTIFVLACVYVA